MAIYAANAQLTTPQTSNISRTKYFPIEVSCSNMFPNTTYDAYADGQIINAFVKPFGGVLGGPLTANSSGKLTFQYHVGIPYNQSYLVNPNVSNTNLVESSITLTLVDPYNRSSTKTIPLLFKSGSL
jgi:hypothetical protein